MNGLISQSLAWIEHPSNDNSSLMDWFGGLILILIVSFLWSTVVRDFD